MSEQSNQSSKSVLIIIILLIVLLGSIGGWYFFIYKPAQETKEKARLEQLAKEAEEKKAAELAQKKANYDELITNADAEFAQENWKQAQSLYLEASTIFSDQPYLQDQLSLVNAKLDELSAKKTKGIVETIASSTGRYYVIVSSSIDDDLAMDNAQKIANQGISLKIIAHEIGKLVYYRVSAGDYPTIEKAKEALPTFGSYGDGIWLLKY